MSTDTQGALDALIDAAMTLERECGAAAGFDESNSHWQRLKSAERQVLAALATQPAQPSPAQIASVEELTQQSQKMGFYGECQMRLGIGRCECQESGLGGECIYRLSAPKPAQPSIWNCLKEDEC